MFSKKNNANPYYTLISEKINLKDPRQKAQILSALQNTSIEMLDLIEDFFDTTLDLDGLFHKLHELKKYSESGQDFVKIIYFLQKINIISPTDDLISQRILGKHFDVEKTKDFFTVVLSYLKLDRQHDIFLKTLIAHISILAPLLSVYLADYEKKIEESLLAQKDYYGSNEEEQIKAITTKPTLPKNQGISRTVSGIFSVVSPPPLSTTTLSLISHISPERTVKR